MRHCWAPPMLEAMTCHFNCATPHVMRTQILGFIGMSLKDFENREDAFKVADAEINANAKEYGHKVEKEDRGDPLLDKFFYVKSEGKKRKWSSDQIRELSGTANVKSLKQMEEVGAFVAGLGPGDGDGTAASSVKVENVYYGKVKDAAENLKSE